MADYQLIIKIFNEDTTPARSTDPSRDPLRTCESDMERFVGKESLSNGSPELEYHGHRVINLDDEGDVDVTEADEKAIQLEGTIHSWMNHISPNTKHFYGGAKSANWLQTCDTCRVNGTTCEIVWPFDRQGPTPKCVSCFRKNVLCSYLLAQWAEHWLSLPPGAFHPLSTSSVGKAFTEYARHGRSALIPHPALGVTPSAQAPRLISHLQDPQAIAWQTWLTMVDFGAFLRTTMTAREMKLFDLDPSMYFSYAEGTAIEYSLSPPSSPPSLSSSPSSLSSAAAANEADNLS